MSDSQEFLSTSSTGTMFSFTCSGSLSHDRSTSECSLRNVPQAVSLEELRSELSLLGFNSVPQQRLLQFKQDLEHLMHSRAPLEVSSGSAEDTTGPTKDGEGWDKLPVWSSLNQERSLQAPAHNDDTDSYTKHTLRVGAPNTQKPRPPVLTRKVMRRKSDGQLQVCDESQLSMETDPEGSTVSSGESRAVKSFIRLPPYSLLEQYRQRSDPVGRYQEYKQSWDAFQVSVEKSKKELRWGVRERMMSAPPMPLPRALPTPNSYVIPTEKKRYGLRWAIRQDLVQGNLPGGGSS
ncbi:centriolar and ciliogenesis-associated protein HYLS1 [Hyla sarda]|uniref:centriolar and ciliogenesis-associated protein HYLS1 n=1 Tax=Hyla sarda TaxID=327740 RepID=UPI0024C34D2C|nr:centriolar and ciliogenesis-associated protein HYLS1 [Hyla sarda]XP_056408870.1 centriolar and ciliogenesis-associated protein HYLS1 [Hyla sarda]